MHSNTRSMYFRATVRAHLEQKRLKEVSPLVSECESDEDLEAHFKAVPATHGTESRRALRA